VLVSSLGGITDYRTQQLEVELKEIKHTSCKSPYHQLINLSIVPFVFEPIGLNHTMSALCLLHKRLDST
jgi:hypothetical protein